VRQQFWGEVVECNSDSSAFICECNSEGIIKISQYFPKLLSFAMNKDFHKNKVGRFLRHSVVVGIWNEVLSMDSALLVVTRDNKISKKAKERPGL